MRFFFDNCLSPKIVEGLRAFGETEVEHLTATFEKDEPDEAWLPYVGENNMILVTRDEKMRWRPAERYAFHKHSIGVFLLGGKNIGGWDRIVQVVRNWTMMNELAESTQRPFAFRIRAKGTNFKRVEI